MVLAVNKPKPTTTNKPQSTPFKLTFKKSELKSIILHIYVNQIQHLFIHDFVVKNEHYFIKSQLILVFFDRVSMNARECGYPNLDIHTREFKSLFFGGKYNTVFGMCHFSSKCVEANYLSFTTI